MGQKLDPHRHQISELIEGSGEEEDAVVSVVRPGVIDSEGDVLRFVIFNVVMHLFVFASSTYLLVILCPGKR